MKKYLISHLIFRQLLLILFAFTIGTQNLSAQCAGNCGDVGYCPDGSDAGCYCDSECEEFNDCCPDACEFCSTCGGTQEPSCSTGGGECGPGEVELVVTLTTDDFGAEMTMVLTDADGNIIAAVGNSIDQTGDSDEECNNEADYGTPPFPDGETIVFPSICLPCNTSPSAYTFTIYDAYGDGFEDSEEAGYSVTLDGVVVASGGGDFGCEEATSFGTGESESCGAGPTISRTNPNDPSSFDPCSCGDPLNYYNGSGNITYFHDFVEVTSVTGETWEVTAVSAQAYSDNGATNIVIGDGLTETAIGSGIYRIDLFHPPGVGFTMTVDRTAGGPSFPLMEGGTCTACLQIPTLGQWGLILLSLLILTFGVVALRKHDVALAGANGATIPVSNRSLPFNKATFGKMLIVVMLGLAAIFAVAIGFFGYEMTMADVPGSLVCGPLLAYLLHLLIGKK